MKDLTCNAVFLHCCVGTSTWVKDRTPPSTAGSYTLSSLQWSISCTVEPHSNPKRSLSPPAGHQRHWAGLPAAPTHGLSQRAAPAHVGLLAKGPKQPAQVQSDRQHWNCFKSLVCDQKYLQTERHFHCSQLGSRSLSVYLQMLTRWEVRHTVKGLQHRTWDKQCFDLIETSSV